MKEIGNKNRVSCVYIGCTPNCAQAVNMYRKLHTHIYGEHPNECENVMVFWFCH